MAILRTLNEFICEPVVLALEPSRKCVCSCTYCFSEINNSIQHVGKSRRVDDDGSFESTLTKAYSPSYDQTDFLQWGLHNRLVLGYANGVEPFQNIPQARNLLSALNQFNIPLFIQTKGINFDAVSDLLLPFHDNATVFVSIPSLNPKYVKRFEPGTPPIEARLEVIDWLADHDFWVIAALSPYHESFCQDPTELVDTLTDHGVNQIFFDRLHLNQRQVEAAKDRVMAGLAGGVRSGHPIPWPPEARESFKLVYRAAMANELDFVTSGFDGVAFGYPNTLPSVSPVEMYTRGRSWPYFDGKVFHVLENIFYDEGIDILDRDFDDSIVVTWDDCLRIMEADGGIDQPFKYSSLTDIIHIYRHISDSWKSSIGKLSPIRDYYRALWNNPRSNQFIWRHPWIRVATSKDGIPLLDPAGNLIGLFDPDFDRPAVKKHFRPVDSIEVFRPIVQTPVAG